LAEPMYRRIAEDLKNQIASGGIAPGRQLPTELELRTQYEAARNTVRDAILLASQGLVETGPELGTFAVRRLEPLVTTFSVTPMPVPAELASSAAKASAPSPRSGHRAGSHQRPRLRVSVEPAPELIAGSCA
jgi:DNA-binding GntR family transcriptional regulator